MHCFLLAPASEYWQSSGELEAMASKKAHIWPRLGEGLVLNKRCCWRTRRPIELKQDRFFWQHWTAHLYGK